MKKKTLMALTLLLFTFSKAQIGVKTISPSIDSDISLGSNNKGLLLNRVALVTLSSPSPLSSHVKGMYVYNTIDQNDVREGIYYNNGTKWVRLVSEIPNSPTARLVALSIGYPDSTLAVSYTSSSTYFRRVGFPTYISGVDQPFFSENNSLYRAPVAGEYQITSSIYLTDCPALDNNKNNIGRIMVSSLPPSSTNANQAGVTESFTKSTNATTNMVATVFLNQGDYVWVDYGFNFPSDMTVVGNRCQNQRQTAHRLAIYRFE